MASPTVDNIYARLLALEARVGALGGGVGLLLDATGSLTLGTSLATVPGLSTALDVGAYHIRGQVLLNPTVSGGTPGYQLTGSGGLTASSSRFAWVENSGTNSSGSFNDGGIGSGWNSAAIGAGLADRITRFDGAVLITVAGTINVQVKLSSGSASVFQYGSYLEVIPG